MKKTDQIIDSQSLYINNKGSIQSSLPSLSPQLEHKKSEKKKNT